MVGLYDFFWLANTEILLGNGGSARPTPTPQCASADRLAVARTALPAAG